MVQILLVLLNFCQLVLQCVGILEVVTVKVESGQLRKKKPRGGEGTGLTCLETRTERDRAGDVGRQQFVSSFAILPPSLPTYKSLHLVFVPSPSMPAPLLFLLLLLFRPGNSRNNGMGATCLGARATIRSHTTIPHAHTHIGTRKEG